MRTVRAGSYVLFQNLQVPANRSNLDLHASWIFVSLSWAWPDPGMPFVIAQRYVLVPEQGGARPLMFSRCAVTRENLAWMTPNSWILTLRWGLMTIVITLFSCCQVPVSCLGTAVVAADSATR